MKPQTVITVVCMYCKATIYVKDGLGVSGVSHGICADCVPAVSAGIVAEMREINARRALEARA